MKKKRLSKVVGVELRAGGDLHGSEKQMKIQHQQNEKHRRMKINEEQQQQHNEGQHHKNLRKFSQASTIAGSF